MYDFGIFIEMAPDEEQKAMLEQNIQMALAQKDISLEDAIDIRELNNLKMANQLLKLKRKKKQELEQAAKTTRTANASADANASAASKISRRDAKNTNGVSS